MQKYLTIFSVSWQNGFVYRLNFILWRVRSVIVILTVYFLWSSLFQNNQVLFGYTKEQMLTYVFLVLILRSVILSLKSFDIAGEIQDGKLSNYLLKPLNYHLYWFTVDISDKILNILFSIFEIIVLYLILKPPLFFQSDPAILIVFALAVVAAMILHFGLGNAASNLSFWLPGNAWGFWFLLFIFVELLGGIMFPLDVLPENIYHLVMLLPFPYLIYFPVKIYLGQVSGFPLWQGFGVMAFWISALIFVVRYEWKKGIIIYEAQGR